MTHASFRRQLVLRMILLAVLWATLELGYWEGLHFQIEPHVQAPGTLDGIDWTKK